MKTITAQTSTHSYPVAVGTDMGPKLKRLLHKEVGAGRLFVFYDANWFALHGAKVKRNFGLPSGRRREFVVPSGEKAKSSGVLTGIYDFMLGEKITRDDFVLACGGGVTSDLVGFAAATVLRGVRWGVATTTLLGMVDASIGGKTGINHGRGKNLIGAFHQPRFVVADLAFLSTLPERQIIAGLGEVLKTAGLSGSKTVAELDTYLGRGDLFDFKLLGRLVHDCATLKAKIVGRDEHEAGIRMILNYGHTFAHGIEKTLGYGRLLHGEAVILGIDAALELGQRLGLHTAGIDVYQGVVQQLMRCLPQRKMAASQVLSAMALDKKRSATDQRYVILKKLGSPIIRGGIDRNMVRSALETTLKHYQNVRGHR